MNTDQIQYWQYIQYDSVHSVLGSNSSIDQ